MDKYRELDCWIAENVMGFQWRRSRVTGRRCLYPPNRWPDWMDRPADMAAPLVTDWKECLARWIPCYSSDISAAMEVVSKMRERGSDYFELTQQPDGDWFAEFCLHGEGYTQYATTPALAICLAAQAAITAEGEAK
jgi:hypothetical protein